MKWSHYGMRSLTPHRDFHVVIRWSMSVQYCRWHQQRDSGKVTRLPKHYQTKDRVLAPGPGGRVSRIAFPDIFELIHMKASRDQTTGVSISAAWDLRIML